MRRIFGDFYWPPALLGILVAMTCVAGAVWLALEHFNPAPPSTITIATGFKGGAYEFFAQQYQKILARDHVTLNIKLTSGTSDNIRLLEDPQSGVQVAFVQGGTSNSKQAPDLLSLGRVDYQVFWLFYRGSETLDQLTQLKGKRIAVGAEAVVALQILAAAGVNSESATLLPLAGPAAVKALIDGELDVIVLALAPNVSSILLPLFQDPNIRLMNISQSEALTRVFPYLVRLVLPQGVVDLERNIPSLDVNLIGTTNAVVVRQDLHPEIIDLLAKALVEAHGGVGVFQHAGEFPSQTDPEFLVADGARELYKNGPSSLSKYLSFATIGLIKKVIAVLLSCAVILVPFSNFLPKLTRWFVRDRMLHLYRQVRSVETNMRADLTVSQLDALQSELEKIDQAADDLGVPVRHSDLFFELKNHIHVVRQRLGLRSAALQK